MPEFREKVADAGSPQPGKALGVHAVILPHVGEMARMAFRALAACGDDVPTLAVRSPQIDGCGAVATPIVDWPRHEFHVRATNAGAVPAQVISLKPWRAIRHREMMRPDRSRPFQMKFTVTVWLDSSKPNPARTQFRPVRRNESVLVDFFPEALSCGPIRRHAANLSTKDGC